MQFRDLAIVVFQTQDYFMDLEVQNMVISVDIVGDSVKLYFTTVL